MATGGCGGLRGGFACALAACALLAGCESFDELRTARFASDGDDGGFATVAYARTGHEGTFVTPRGVEMTYKSGQKVRVELPDGDAFTAYRVLSDAGMLYETDDGRWRYLEMGAACLASERLADGSGYELKFRGVLFDQRDRPPERTRPRDTSKAQTVLPEGLKATATGTRRK